MTTPTNHTPAKFEFISNPFKSSFDGLSKLFKLNQTPAVVIMIIALFGGLLNSISSLPGSSTDSSTAPVDENVSMTIVAIIIAVALVIAVVATVLGAIYTGVVNYVAWKTSRNESTDLGEAFEQTMKRFWRILLIQIIVGFKIFFGFIFFIVPGIRAALRYQMVYITMFDEDLNTWKSMDPCQISDKEPPYGSLWNLYCESALIPNCHSDSDGW
jgi:hypothetical protein